MSFLPCCKKGTGETQRVVRVKDGAPEYASSPGGYMNNEVTTTRYTWWNFFFVNLFEQFCILANVYFLIIAIFQIIPQFTVSNGTPSMLYPLVFIILVSMVRSAFEDIQRYRADKKRNGFLYDVVSRDAQGKPCFIPTESGSLQVGSIIRIKKNEMIPSDVLFLGSSNPKGICFIDKSNLNGETKLEVYSSLRETRHSVAFVPEGLTREEVDEFIHKPPEESLLSTVFELIYELPNKIFDDFKGKLYLSGAALHGDDTGADKALTTSSSSLKEDHIELSPTNGGVPAGKEVRCTGHELIMRECILRNTHYIYGMIAYTGNDTKIQRSTLESEKSPLKVSQIMRNVNKYLIGMFTFQIVLCIVGGLITGLWYHDNGDAWYFQQGVVTRKDSILVGIYAFFTWMINLSYLVPVSFIVSAEMVKFIMSFFINADVLLYNPEVLKAAHCNNSTIHEDLGLVNYICSDKVCFFVFFFTSFSFTLVLSSHAQVDSQSFTS